MPELPEVETLRRDAEALLVGRTIRQVELLLPAVLRAPAPDAFCQRLEGASFTGARRRAKYLLLDLSTGDTLALALVIYGQLVLVPPDEPAPEDLLFRLTLDNDSALMASDPSHFTRVWLAPRREIGGLLGVNTYGPEPLEADFTPAVLGARLGRRRARLKGLLLDQHVVAGLGNIYVDEALWQARLHPSRRADSLRPAELEALHAAIRAVLEAGIADRGTTFHTYRDLRGAPGEHQHHLAVFQRQGRPCPRCGTTVIRTKLASRDTHLCPACQPEPE